MSVDLPEVIADRRHLHGLQATMLSDQQLTVTDKFDCETRGFIRRQVARKPRPYRAATLLIDESGKVAGRSLRRLPTTPDPGRPSCHEAHFDIAAINSRFDRRSMRFRFQINCKSLSGFALLPPDKPLHGGCAVELPSRWP